MFYEFRKLIVGFRLKLVFESNVRSQNAYIFVDRSKTPTVDSLLTEIVQQFNLGTDIRLTLKECEVLPTENILVLADVEEVRIHRFVQTNSPPERESSDSHSRGTDRGGPSDGNSSNKKDSNEGLPEYLHRVPLSTRCFPPGSGVDRAFAGFFEQLRMEGGRGNTGSEIRMVRKKESFYNEVVRTECSDVVSPLVEDQDMIDLNELDSNMDECTSEKKKRKRKRKHAKKAKLSLERDFDQVDSKVRTESVEQPVHGKHTHFSDDDNLMNRSACSEQKIPLTCVEAVPPSTTTSSFYSSSRKTSETNRDQNTNLESSSCVSGTETSLIPKSLQTSSSTEKQLGTLLMLKDLKTSCQYNVEYVNRGKGDTRTETHDINVSGPEVQITYACADVSNKHAIKKRSFSPKRSNLMSFDESARDAVALETTSDLIDITDPGSIIKVIKSKDRKESISDKQISMDVSLTQNQMDDGASNECEMLLHFKVLDDCIYLRNSNSGWKLLSVEIAANELPCVTEPADGQSIVFQVLYLKHNVWPTLSEIIFGRILKCSAARDEVAMEIPPVFMKKLLRSNVTEELTNSLPEGITHIDGSVYELEWLAVKNPKLLS